MCGLEGANSTEMDPETPYPVIDLLPEQKEIEDLGGTMRLGAQAVELGEGTRTREIYGEADDSRAPPSPLRGQQPVPRSARRARARRLGHVPGGEARRDRRAARSSRGSSPASSIRSSSRARRARRRSSVASSERRSSGRGRAPPSPSRPHAERPSRSLPRALRDPEPSGRGAGRRRPRARRAPRHRPRVGRGRGRGRRRLDDGEHPLPPAGPGRRGNADLPLRPSRHGASVRADRARRRGRHRPERRRHDPRRRRQVRGRRDARGCAEDRGRGACRTPAWSCSSRRRRRSGCSARTRSTTRASRPGSATSTTRRRRSARSSSARRPRRRSRPASTAAPSHAGMYPEEGRSAILAAARAIADMRLGRIDHQSSANVGVITGGTARNIVPEWCSFEAEARSRDPKTVAMLVQEMLDAIGFAASTSDCTAETEIEDTYAGLHVHRRTSRRCSSRRRAAPRRATSRRPGSRAVAPTRTCSTSAGFPCVNLANGMSRDPHGRRAHRRRRSRGDGRGDARDRRGGAGVVRWR